MEAIATCIEGTEEIIQREIKELTKAKSEILIPSRIKFNVKDEKSLADFIYNSRSIIKAYKLISNFTFKNFDEILINIKKIKLPNIKSPFAVKCERIGEHDFSSIEVECEIGNIINKGNKLKVNLTDPTTIVIVDIINNNCSFGIDYTGIKLSKRFYRIRLTPNSINPCLAYSLLRIADTKDKDKILDPFCKSGEIIIEAALYFKKIPPNIKNLEELSFMKLINYKPKNKTVNKKLNLYAIDGSQNNLKSAEINSKIAQVHKDIKFSRYDIEWLDTKFKEHSIDKIITFPPYPTNALPQEKVEKLYKELFYQAEFILKNNGSISILSSHPELIEKHAKQNNFKKDKIIKIDYIHKPFYILVFKR